MWDKNATCEIKMRDKTCEMWDRVLRNTRNLTKKGKAKTGRTDSQYDFSGFVALSKPSNYSFALTSMSFRDFNLFCKMWSGIFNNYIDDIFSLWDCKRNEVERFIEQANTFHPTIKFTAEISENEITFLETVVFKGERFIKKFILDTKTHYRPTETFQYTQFTSCHPPGVKRGFNKGEAI